LGLGGLTGPAFHHQGLENLLKSKTGNNKLSQLLKPAFFTSFDGSRFHPFVFDSVRSRYLGDSHDYYLYDVGRCTSAAPTYFEPHKLISVDGKQMHGEMLDGGMTANNPSGIAISGASTFYFGTKRIPRVRNIFLLSLGTGKLDSDDLDHTPSSEIQWIKPMINVLFSSSSDTVDCTVRANFVSYQSEGYYVRLQPNLAGKCSSEMSEISQKKFGCVEKSGRRYCQKWN